MSLPQTDADMLRIETLDRKYTVVQGADGRLMALRYGKLWRECVGDNLILTLAMDCETLRAQLAAAQADTRRLDWLASNPYGNLGRVGNLLPITGYPTETANDCIRAAIDATMQEAAL